MGFFYEDLKKYQKEIYFILISIGLFILIKYVIIYILPFLLAVLYLYFIRKPLTFIYTKTKIGKGFIAGLFLVIILALTGWLLCKICMAGLQQLKYFLWNIEFYKRSLCDLIHFCCCCAENRFGLKPMQMEALILDKTNVVINDLKCDFLPKVLGQTVIYGQSIFSFFMFIFVTVISVVIMAPDYDLIVKKVKNISCLNEILKVLKRLLSLIGTYLKAQLEIMCMISLICFFGFLASGFSRPYIWALVTGFLDMLPFIGTSIILIPLVFMQLLLGNVKNAIIFLISYLICIVSRELIEPKLVGFKMGILPIGILMSVYVGVKVFGASGFLWGPLYLLTLFEVYKRLYH